MLLKAPRYPGQPPQQRTIRLQMSSVLRFRNLAAEGEPVRAPRTDRRSPGAPCDAHIAAAHRCLEPTAAPPGALNHRDLAPILIPISAMKGVTGSRTRGRSQGKWRFTCFQMLPERSPAWKYPAGLRMRLASLQRPPGQAQPLPRAGLQFWGTKAAGVGGRALWLLGQTAPPAQPITGQVDALILYLAPHWF